MRLTILCTALALLTACSSQTIEAYENKEPTISVREFYGQPIAGYGIFQNGSGEVTDRYYATLVPHWDGNQGTIVEKQWNDKGKLFLEQTWHITLGADGKTFTATASKIDGLVNGETRGYAMHMTYTMLAPRDDGSEIAVDGDDWTYLTPDGSAINRVRLSKYGYHVGDITYDLKPLAKGEKLRTGYFIQ